MEMVGSAKVVARTCGHQAQPNGTLAQPRGEWKHAQILTCKNKKTLAYATEFNWPYSLPLGKIGAVSCDEIMMIGNPSGCLKRSSLLQPERGWGFSSPFSPFPFCTQACKLACPANATFPGVSFIVHAINSGNVRL